MEQTQLDLCPCFDPLYMWTISRTTIYLGSFRAFDGRPGAIGGVEPCVIARVKPQQQVLESNRDGTWVCVTKVKRGL